MTSEAAALLAGNLALVFVVVVALSWLVYGNLRQRATAGPPTFGDWEVAYRDLSRDMAEMRDRHEAELSDMKEQQASDHQAIRQLRSEVLRIDADLQRWRMAYAMLMHEFMEVAGHAPKTQPPDAAPAAIPVPPAPVDRGRLAALMIEYFSVEEVDGLAFELSLSSAVAGDTVEARARSLIEAARRRKRLDALIALCRRERPEGEF